MGLTLANVSKLTVTDWASCVALAKANSDLYGV